MPDNGLAGLGDGPIDWLSAGGRALLEPAQKKLDDLDLSIKALLVLGSISALTGLAMVFRR